MLKNALRFLAVASAEGIIGWIASNAVVAGVKDATIRDLFLVLIWPVLIVSGTVVFVAWVWSNGRQPQSGAAPVGSSTRPPKQEEAAPPPRRMPRATRAPSKPRVFVPPSVTPEYLTEFFQGHTTAQGQRSVADYLGKWMRIDGPVGNVQVFENAAVVTIYVKVPTRVLPDVFVGLWFPRSLVQNVSLMSAGDELSVIGRITKVTQSNVDLEDCELVE